LHDIRFGLRSLFRYPTTSGLAIVTLALAIGILSAIFSVVWGVLLKPLDLPDPGRLLMIWENNLERGMEHGPVASGNFSDWRDQATSFSGLVAISQRRFTLSGDTDPELIRGDRVTANFWSALRVEPILGRGFLPGEDMPGAEAVAVLGYDLWQRSFGGDEGVLDRMVSVDGNLHRVVGVAPPGFELINDTELWAPLGFDVSVGHRGARHLLVLGRLAEGASIGEARAEMETIAAQIASEYPDTNGGWSVTVMPLLDVYVEEYKPVLTILLLAGFAVLLIACANVANLLLSRAAARQRELAVRDALGARRRHLVRMMLAESLILSVVAGALGALLAVWGTRILVALAGETLPRAEELGVDPWVVAFTFVVAVATGVGIGLVPAWTSFDGRVSELLKEGGSVGGGRRGRWSRQLLVVVETALAVVLLLGAALFLRSLVNLQSVDMGFRTEGVTTMSLRVPRGKYSTMEQGVAFYEEILNHLSALPGVERAGSIHPLPLDPSSFALRYWTEDGLEADEGLVAHITVASPDAFQILGIELLQGRVFTPADNLTAPHVAVVNEKMAREIAGDGRAIGRQITFDNPNVPERKFLEVVGIVRDTRSGALNENPPLQVYWSVFQRPAGFEVMVKSDLEHASIVPSIRAAVRELDPDVPVTRIQPLDRQVERSLSQSQFKSLLVTVFAGLSLVLAGVGIYGIVSHAVTRRQREIGIRMALGARGSEVVGLMVRDGIKVVGIGLGLGAAGALATGGLASSYLADQLFGVGLFDPLSLAIVPLVLLAVAFVANLVPALRATRVDPAEVLRAE